MAKAFLSYTWADNDDGDVEWVANSLNGAGLEIHLDRWTLTAGRRLWEQIEALIFDKENCDALLIFATSASLANERCREEIAYALDRALSTRGANFPIIGIFQGHVASEFIPASIRTRLYVSLNDDHWVERVVAGCEGRSPAIPRSEIQPYSIKVHHKPKDGVNFAIEIRPRAGVWAPFLAGIALVQWPKPSHERGSACRVHPLDNAIARADSTRKSVFRSTSSKFHSFMVFSRLANKKTGQNWTCPILSTQKA